MVKAPASRVVRIRAFHCVAFLGKTLDFHSASLHPGEYVTTGELNAGYYYNPAVDWDPIQGGRKTPSHLMLEKP